MKPLAKKIITNVILFIIIIVIVSSLITTVGCFGAIDSIFPFRDSAGCVGGPEMSGFGIGAADSSIFAVIALLFLIFIALVYFSFKLYKQYMSKGKNENR